MCGICGIFNFKGSIKITEESIIKMNNMIGHRGPDDSGFFVDENIGLGQVRLSIIDLSIHGHQPYVSDDGRYKMIFNGEIFNYRELRIELEKNGVNFKSNSDTEVLFYLLINYGVNCLNDLNGMFAIAFFDSHKGELLLIRDRIGVKPLYYSIINGILYFASEPKAILVNGISIELNSECADEHLLYRYISGENTIFKEIKKVLPGHFIRINIGICEIEKYSWWHFRKIQNQIKYSDENFFKNFTELFKSSVKLRTISDVPFGIMLSGGLDSGSVASALSIQDFNKISAFTITFNQKEHDEEIMAKLVSSKFDFSFNPIRIENSEIMALTSEASWLLDEPIVHQNDPQILLLSKTAKKQVKVLLSGEGGDEFLGGYIRYKPLLFFRFFGLLRPFLKFISILKISNRFVKLNRYLKEKSIDNLVLTNVCDIYPVDLNKYGVEIDLDGMEYRQEILKQSKLLYPDEPSRQAMYFDLFTHMSSILDRNDRMTMGAGIECRVPFMDYRLMEFMISLPSKLLFKGKKGKYILLNTLGNYLPSKVKKFKKIGLSVPWDDYLKNNLEFDDFIVKLNSSESHFFYKKINLKLVLDDFNKGDTIAIAIIKQLFMFDVWYNKYYNYFKKLTNE